MRQAYRRGAKYSKRNAFALIVAGVCIGAPLGLFFCVLAIFAAIIKSYSVAMIFFPYSVVTHLSLLKASMVTLIIAMAQYPLYGGICGYVCSLTGRNRRLAIPILLLLIIFHFTAVFRANQRFNEITSQQSGNASINYRFSAR